MPNIRVSGKTLSAVKQVGALFTLETGESYTLDEVVQMMAGDFLKKLTIKNPQEIRQYADTLEKLSKQRKRSRI